MTKLSVFTTPQKRERLSTKLLPFLSPLLMICQQLMPTRVQVSLNVKADEPGERWRSMWAVWDGTCNCIVFLWVWLCVCARTCVCVCVLSPHSVSWGQVMRESREICHCSLSFNSCFFPFTHYFVSLYGYFWFTSPLSKCLLSKRLLIWSDIFKLCTSLRLHKINCRFSDECWTYWGATTLKLFN